MSRVPFRIFIGGGGGGGAKTIVYFSIREE